MHCMETQLSVRLPEDLRTALRARAEREQRTEANMVRLILSAALGGGGCTCRTPTYVHHEDTCSLAFPPSTA
jgi:plasmid stability protein